MALSVGPGREKTLMHLNIATIVLNGMPWIERHLAVFEKLSIPWTWSIAHGIADPVADTAWVKRVDRVADDDTARYLKCLGSYERMFPRCGHVVTQFCDRWPGKTAQINAALSKFIKPGILLQLDADELWTTEQLEIMVRLFETYPWATHAAFASRLFVGPRRVVTHPGSYGNRWSYEWHRAWQWAPGQKFTSHEPPALEGSRPDKILSHGFTACAGLVFDHMSYATEAQVAFKEAYYGYEGAVEAWRRLQQMRGPVDLRKVLPWVVDHAMSYELP